MQKNKCFQYVFAVMIVLVISGCATYYMQSGMFHQKFLNGEIEAANKILDQDKKSHKKKNKILYYLNKGILLQMMQDHTGSMEYFQLADHYIEDQRKTIGNEALALITNPTIKPYVPEDFESVMVNFYQALNYLQVDNMEEALVECRRVNEKLYALNDKYPKKYKNRYSDDAFVHTIMGLIYDASGDSNNAFIAYRNAFTIYSENYQKNFNTTVPYQLKKDLLRTAYLTGLREEYEFYKKQFEMDYSPRQANKGEIVFFWLNGMGPVKSEWSINFTAIHGNDGFLTLADDTENVSFPFFIGDMSAKEKNAFSDLEFVRVAFPKYVERPLVFTNAQISLNDSTYFNLEKGEDINAIAFKSLRDRMLREMANSLLRLATKKALEAYVREQNGDFGTLLGIANALTEKADTRNWQTLPHSIYYARVSVPTGEQQVKLIVTASNGAQKEHLFTFPVKKGKTQFFSFHNLECEAVFD